MATAQEYASWLQRNSDKRGTPDYQTVLRAFQEASLEELDAQRAVAAAPQGPQESTIGSELARGFKQLVSTSRTGIGALTEPEEAARAGVERGRQIAAEAGEGPSFAALRKVYEEQGLLPAVGELASQVPRALAGQAAQLGAMAGGAKLGAMAGSAVLPGPGTFVGGVLGAGATLLPQFFGANVERQAAEQMERGEPVSIDRGTAAAAAAGQAGIEAAGTAFVLGKRVVKGILGITDDAALATAKAREELVKAATRSRLGAAGRGAAVGLAEIPVEVAQAVIERAQAGLDVLSPEALSEYGENAYLAGLVGPTIGGATRVTEPGAARRTLAVEEQEKAAAAAKTAREAEAAEKASPEYIEGVYDSYQQLLQQQKALEAQIKKGSKEAPLSQEDKDSNAVVNKQLDEVKKEVQSARRTFIDAGGPQAMAKLRAGRLELTPHPDETPVVEEETEAPEVARARAAQQVRGLTDLLEQQRTQLAATEDPEEAVRLGEQTQRTYGALSKAQEELGKFPAQPAQEDLQKKLKSVQKKFETARSAGDQDKVVKYGRELLELRQQLRAYAPDTGLFAPELDEAAMRERLGEEIGAQREAAGYERRGAELEQEFAREKDARDAAVRQQLEEEGLAEREALTGLAQEQAAGMRARELGRVRAAPQLGLFPEAREKVLRTVEGRHISGEQALLQEQIGELEKRRAATDRPERAADIDKQLSALRARLQGLEFETIETQRTAIPGETPEAVISPPATRAERVDALIQQVLAAPQVDEETKALVQQAQDNLPAFRKQMPLLENFLYRARTGSVNAEDAAEVRDVLAQAEEGRRSETETLPTGEVRRAVQMEIPLPEPKATAFGSFGQFNDYLAGEGLQAYRSQMGLVFPTVANLQRRLAPIQAKVQQLKTQLDDLNAKRSALQKADVAERESAAALLRQSQNNLKKTVQELEDVARVTYVGDKYKKVDLLDAQKQASQRLADAFAHSDNLRAQFQENLAKLDEAQAAQETVMVDAKGQITADAKKSVREVQRGQLPGYQKLRDAQLKLQQKGLDLVEADKKLERVVKDGIGQSWDEGSPTLRAYIAAKKEKDNARRDAQQAHYLVVKAYQAVPGKETLNQNINKFIAQKDELDAQIAKAAKSIGGYRLNARNAAERLNEAFVRMQNIPELRFGENLQRLRNDLLAAENIRDEVMQRSVGRQAQAEVLGREAAEVATPLRERRELMQRVTGAAERRAQARVAPEVRETQAEREARDAEKRREEQARLERLERSEKAPRTRIEFEREFEEDLADETYANLVAQTYDDTLPADKRMAAAEAADAYLAARREKRAADAEAQKGKAATHQARLDAANTELANLQAAKDKLKLTVREKRQLKTPEAQQAKLKEKQDKFDAKIAEVERKIETHQKNLNAAQRYPAVTRTDPASLREYREALNEEILRGRSRGERLGPRAVGPVTRPEVFAPREMRTGSQESREGLTTTQPDTRLKEARGVPQRDVPMSKKESAKANLDAAELRVSSAKTPSEKRLAEAELAVAEARYEIAVKGDSNARARALAEAEAEVEALRRTSMRPVEKEAKEAFTAEEEAEYQKELAKERGEKTTKAKKKKAEPANMFLQELNKMTTESPGEKGLRAFGDVEVEARRVYDKVVHIGLIRNIGELRQGKASEVLNKLTALADKHGVVLNLMPEKVGKKGPSAEKLAAWYAKHGFVPWDAGMYRNPKTPAKKTRSRALPEDDELVADELEVLDGFREETFFSRGPTADPSTTASVRKELSATFPDLGRVQIFDSVEALVEANPQYDGLIPDDARGFVDSAGNKAFLIAENINKGDSLAVLLHEVGAHIGLKNMLGAPQYNALVKAVETWAKRNDGSPEARVAKAAQERVKAAKTPANQKDDETLAYAIEEAVKAGVTPTQTKSPLGQWLARIAQAFRKALEKFGLPPKALDAQGLVDMAFGAAKMEMRPATPQMSRRTFLRGASAAVGAMKLPPLSKEMNLQALRSVFDASLDARSAWFGALKASVKNKGLGNVLDEYADLYEGDNPLVNFTRSKALQNFLYNVNYNENYEGEGYDYNLNELLSGKDGVKVVADLQQALRAQGASLVETTQKMAKEKGLPEVGELFFAKKGAPLRAFSDAFRKWFGNSKVVDDTGAPLVVYHGTAEGRDISEFMATGENGDTLYANGDAGKGIYFSDGQNIPNTFAWAQDVRFGGTVYPVYLKVDKLLTLEPGEKWGWGETYIENMKKAWRDTTYDGMRYRAIDVGQDSAGDPWAFTNGSPGEWVYVVRKPTQIKSATGNIGTYDPANPDIRFSRNLPTASRVADSLIAKERSWLDKLKDNFLGMGARTQFVDKLAPTEEALKRGGADPTKAMQAMYYLRMYDQRMHFTSQAITDGVPELATKTRRDGTTERLIETKPGANIKQIVDILKKKDVVKAAGSADAANKLFTLYLAAIRGDRVGYDTLNFGRVWAEAEVKRIESQLKDAKLSQEQRAVLQKRKKALQDKIPKMPTEADIKAARAEIEADSTLKQAFDEARDIYNQYNRNLLEFAVQTGALSRAEANRLLANNDYVPYYRMRDGVAELIIGNETPIRIGNLKDSPHLKELVGGDEAIFDFLTSSVQNTSMLLDMATKNLATKNLMFELRDVGLATVAKVPKSGKTPEGAVTFKRDGEDYFAVVDTDAIGIDSDLLVKGLAGIPTMFPAFVRVFGVPARLLRRAVVASPVYMARQLFRDTLGATLTSGADIVPVLSALKQIGKPNVLQGRGITGGQVFTGMPEDVTRMLKDMQAGKISVTSGLSWLEAKAAQVDALTRQAQYDSYIKQGLSEMEATYMALESMNFSKRGLSPTLHMFSTLIPFFNAQIQGLDVLYKAFTGQMPMNERLAIREKLWTRGLLIAGMSMAYAAAMQDDRAYKNAKPEEKYGNWFVRISGFDEPVRLPIPFELGYVFKSLPEAMVNIAMNDKGAEEAQKALTHIVQQMIPGASSYFIPQAVKPALEALAFEKSLYTGRGIESAKDQEKEPGYRARESTTELARQVGELTGFSPIKMEYLIRGYTGSMGMALLAALSAPFGSSGPEAATKRLSDLPVVGTLFQPNDASGIIDATYERVNKIQQVQQTYKALLNDGRRDDAKAYADRNINDMMATSIAGEFRQIMGDITAQEREVRASGLTPDKKREMLERFRQAKIRIATSVRAALDRKTPQAALA